MSTGASGRPPRWRRARTDRGIGSNGGGSGSIGVSRGPLRHSSIGNRAGSSGPGRARRGGEAAGADRDRERAALAPPRTWAAAALVYPNTTPLGSRATAGRGRTSLRGLDLARARARAGGGGRGGRARARSGEAPGRGTPTRPRSRATIDRRSAHVFARASRRAGSSARRRGASTHARGDRDLLPHACACDAGSVAGWVRVRGACDNTARGSARARHATRVRSHAGTGEGVAARSECRHAIGRGKSRARRAFLNRRFWVHAARGGRTASSGARRSRRFFGINQSVFLGRKKCISRSTRASKADANFHALLAFRASRLDKSRARECAPVGPSPSRLLPSRPVPRVASADSRSESAWREPPRARGPRSASATGRASSSRASGFPRASRSPFVEKGRLAGGGKSRLDDQINRASEASAGPVAPRPLPSSRARAGLRLNSRARASADAVRAPRRAGLGRGWRTAPPDGSRLLDRASRTAALSRSARGPARREPPRPIRRGRRQGRPKRSSANDVDDDEFAARVLLIVRIGWRRASIVGVAPPRAPWRPALGRGGRSPSRARGAARSSSRPRPTTSRARPSPPRPRRAPRGGGGQAPRARRVRCAGASIAEGATTPDEDGCVGRRRGIGPCLRNPADPSFAAPSPPEAPPPEAPPSSPPPPPQAPPSSTRARRAAGRASPRRRRRRSRRRARETKKSARAARRRPSAGARPALEAFTAMAVSPRAVPALASSSVIIARYPVLPPRLRPRRRSLPRPRLPKAAATIGAEAPSAGARRARPRLVSDGPRQEPIVRPTRRAVGGRVTERGRRVRRTPVSADACLATVSLYQHTHDKNYTIVS